MRKKPNESDDDLLAEVGVRMLTDDGEWLPPIHVFACNHATRAFRIAEERGLAPHDDLWVIIRDCMKDMAAAMSGMRRDVLRVRGASGPAARTAKLQKAGAVDRHDMVKKLLEAMPEDMRWEPATVGAIVRAMGAQGVHVRPDYVRDVRRREYDRSGAAIPRSTANR